MGGGAWPFLVGGVICQVNSGNERDLRLLNSHVMVPIHGRLLRGTTGGELAEVGGNNRSTYVADPGPAHIPGAVPVCITGL